MADVSAQLVDLGVEAGLAAHLGVDRDAAVYAMTVESQDLGEHQPDHRGPAFSAGVEAAYANLVRTPVDSDEEAVRTALLAHAASVLGYELVRNA